MRLKKIDSNRVRPRRPEGEPIEHARDSLPRTAALNRRLNRIKAALRDETWLPLGLRTLIAEAIPRLRKGFSAKPGTSRFEAARDEVHEMALASFTYGPWLLESETVTQLRVLDLELNPLPPVVEGWEMSGSGRDTAIQRVEQDCLA